MDCTYIALPHLHDTPKHFALASRSPIHTLMHSPMGGCCYARHCRASGQFGQSYNLTSKMDQTDKQTLWYQADSECRCCTEPAPATAHRKRAHWHIISRLHYLFEPPGALKIPVATTWCGTDQPLGALTWPALLCGSGSNEWTVKCFLIFITTSLFSVRGGSTASW